MEAIEDLKKTIRITTELHSLVKTMKVLAGVNIRQYERAVEAIADYNRTIELGLQAALPNLPEHALPRRASGARMAAIVFGSDQGMCGQLNDLVVAHSARAMKKLAFRREEQTVCAVGLRAAAQLEDLGQRVENTLPVPGSIPAIGATVHDLLVKLEDWHLRRGIGMIVLFYCQPISGTSYRPRGLRLLPIDLEWIHSLKARDWPSKTIPLYTMDEVDLYHALIREYLFSSLFRALADSLASENASRLLSMQVADRNIQDRLKALTAEFRQSRQDVITSELLDIVAGFEALRVERA